VVVRRARSLLLGEQLIERGGLGLGLRQSQGHTGENQGGRDPALVVLGARLGVDLPAQGRPPSVVDLAGRPSAAHEKQGGGAESTHPHDYLDAHAAGRVASAAAAGFPAPVQYNEGTAHDS